MPAQPTRTARPRRGTRLTRIARRIDQGERCPCCGEPMTTQCAAAAEDRSPSCGA